jgi:hypothetical protein
LLGEDLIVIANCPSCGTHYKHEPPVLKVRARCGRCDTTLDLTRFRAYRITADRVPTAVEAARAAAYSPIGLDHPALATTIANNVVQAVPQAVPLAVAPPAPEPWIERREPAPQVQVFEPSPAPALAVEAAPEAPAVAEPAASDAIPPDTTRRREVRGEFVIWMATATVVGTAASWSMGGSTIAGLIIGAAIGALAFRGWQRWISPS